jgi:hypothetical protein
VKCAYLIPTANPALAAECFRAWRSMGWDTFALVDGNDVLDAAILDVVNFVFRQNDYPGWGESFNIMARTLHEYDWLATGGDDVWPDPMRYAETIGNELSAHFNGTFGVCQPSADRWAWNKNGTTAPICYAPIIGAEFARRWNGGKGAFWPGYFQWCADAELHGATEGLLLERPDLMFDHRHVSKDGRPSPAYKTGKQHRWQADWDLYEQRRRDRFPGHEPTD